MNCDDDEGDFAEALGWLHEAVESKNVEDAIAHLMAERDEARRERDALREAARDVIDWHDALDGEMENVFGRDAIEALAKAAGLGSAGEGT